MGLVRLVSKRYSRLLVCFFFSASAFFKKKMLLLLHVSIGQCARRNSGFFLLSE